MIDRSYGRFELVCDICGEVADDDFETFHDAVDYKKSEEWKSIKVGVDWQDTCPNCQRV